MEWRWRGTGCTGKRGIFACPGYIFYRTTEVVTIFKRGFTFSSIFTTHVPRYFRRHDRVPLYYVTYTGARAEQNENNSVNSSGGSEPIIDGVQRTIVSVRNFFFNIKTPDKKNLPKHPHGSFITIVTMPVTYLLRGGRGY